MDLSPSARFLSHSEMVLNVMRRHRKENTKLCDLNLEVGEYSLPVHRSVLAACSPYFFAMFNGDLKESRQKTVVLKDINYEALMLIIDYAYTGTVNVNSENVEDVLSLATQLQFNEVCNHCCEFLEKQLDAMNCIDIRRFAALHHCKEFLGKIDLFLQSNYNDVVTSDDFSTLPFSVFESILKSDKLNVPKEENVYTSVMKWVRYNVKDRESKFLFLLNEIRMPLLSKEFIMQNLEKEPLIKSNLKCRDLLDVAKNYHMYPEIRASLRCKSMVPRHSTQGFLLAIGGKEAGEEITNNVECYSMYDNTWHAVKPLSCPRQQLGVCELEGKVYAIAGSDGDNRLDTVEVYDYKTNTWESTTPLQTCRSGVGVGVLGGAIYALGGYDGRFCLSSVERFDISSQRWQYIAPTNLSRSFPGVVSLGDCLYVIGGNDGSTFLDTCERYNPHTDKWTLITPMNCQRAGVGCSVLDGLLYVAGGFDGMKRLDFVERYDPRLNTWTVISPMTSCRDGVCMTAYCGYLFAIGGIDGPSYLNSVEYYDPATDTWQESKEMMTSRAAAGVALLPNDVILAAS